MSQPLYFLPGVTWTRGQSLAVTRSILREAGLAEIFSDVSEDHVGWAQIAGLGPDNTSGTVVYYVDGREPPNRCGYYPAQQNWTKAGGIWIGTDKDCKPTPEGLRRRRVHPGWPVELGDGQTYTVPVVRRPDESTNLPTDLIFDAARKLAQPIKPDYVSYWEAAAEVVRWLPAMVTGNGLEAVDQVKALRLAIQALGLNYRYGLQEHNALRLIDGTNLWTVLAMSVDAPRVLAEQEAQKKT